MADISSVTPSAPVAKPSSPKTVAMPSEASPHPAVAGMPVEKPKILPGGTPGSPGPKPLPNAASQDAGKTVLEIHPKLMCRHGSQVFNLDNGTILGRHVQGKEFLAEAKTVSRKHAIFVFEKGSWFVEDLGSTNGTYVNGTMIPAKTRQSIKKGDRIGLSRGITFEIIEAVPET